MLEASFNTNHKAVVYTIEAVPECRTIGVRPCMPLDPSKAEEEDWEEAWNRGEENWRAAFCEMMAGGGADTHD